MIEPRYATLQTLFADRVFRIPNYQRFYSWKTKQREDLFGDLIKLADHGGDNHHFMATIVCYRTSEVKPIGAVEYRIYDIVDGQQRLTTLIIILKCIELVLLSGSSERLELAEKIVKRDGNLILLQTNNINEHIFNAFLREGKLPAEEDVRTHADKNLLNGMRECNSFVKDWLRDKGDIMGLLRLVQNRLGFIVYDTEDGKAVYSIFEVLNSRGLAVDWLDKCKSSLMEKAYGLAKSPEAQDTIIKSLQNIWSNIYREIADVDVSGQEILRVMATLYYARFLAKPLKAHEALEILRDSCDDAEKSIAIGEKILDVTRKLVSIERNVFLGPVTKILHARILAVAIESTDNLNYAERKKALDQWERVTFRIFGLNRKDSRTKVGEYVKLASKITQGDPEISRYSEIMRALREIGSDYPIDEAVRVGLQNVDSYGKPDVCRFILWRYEEYLANHSGKSATIDEHVRRDIWFHGAEDSIEHIYPQNPERGGVWDGKMNRGDGVNEDYQQHINRIGNLILLPIALNNEVRRSGFEVKKEIYIRHNLRMVKEVAECNEWTLSEIEKREEGIVRWAEMEWGDLSD